MIQQPALKLTMTDIWHLILDIGSTEKTFTTEAQSARRKKKVRFGDVFLRGRPLFSL